jgi:hypothetical protein
MRAAVTIAIVLVACGGKQTTGGGGVASGSGSGSAVASDAGALAGTGAGTGTGTTGGAITQEDCVLVLGHIVDVGMAEKKKTMPPDQAPNEEDAAKARQKVIDAGMEECLKMPRAMFDCAMKAQDSAALRACDGQ